MFLFKITYQFNNYKPKKKVCNMKKDPFLRSECQMNIAEGHKYSLGRAAACPYKIFGGPNRLTALGDKKGRHGETKESGLGKKRLPIKRVNCRGARLSV
jgi:hypothetical protein